MRGMILYKDLFEQKGPILYLIYGLASLISPTYYWAVFGFEVLSLWSFLILFDYFMRKQKMVVPYGLFIAASVLLVLMPNFAQGGSAEEFALPFIAYGLLSFQSLFLQKKNLSNLRTLFINGISFAVVFLIKFNLSILWIPLFSIYFIWRFIQLKNYTVLKEVGISFLGFSLVWIPWIVYFVLNHALLDFFDNYFFINLFFYPNTMNYLEHIRFIKDQLIDSLFNSGWFNLAFTVITSIGLFDLLVTKDTYVSLWYKVAVFFSGSLLIYGVYGGGRAYVYYYLGFYAFSLFGIRFLTMLSKLVTNTTMKRILLISLAFLSIGSLILGNRFSRELFKPKERWVQYQYAQYIESNSLEPTVLNYYCLDTGLMFFLDTIPNQRFFMHQNISLDRTTMIIDAQNEYLASKSVNYVIIMRLIGFDETKLNIIPGLSKNYHQVFALHQNYEGKEFIYYLFEINN